MAKNLKELDLSKYSTAALEAVLDILKAQEEQTQRRDNKRVK